MALRYLLIHARYEKAHAFVVIGASAAVCDARRRLKSYLGMGFPSFPRGLLSL